MQILKILILAVFAASTTNINVCSNVLLHKNTADAGNKHLVISSAANTATMPPYSRQDQQGKKTNGNNSLYKIFPVLIAKTRFAFYGSPDSIFAASGKTNDYSLISLHCLLTI